MTRLLVSAACVLLLASDALAIEEQGTVTAIDLKTRSVRYERYDGKQQHEHVVVVPGGTPISEHREPGVSTSIDLSDLRPGDEIVVGTTNGRLDHVTRLKRGKRP